VDIFFDTTVLVAASVQSHPHYVQARSALLRITAGRDKGFMSLHSVAEVFAALTRLPVQPRIHPVEAARIVTENILPHFELVSIGKEDYQEEYDGRRRMDRCKNLRCLTAALRGKVRGSAYLHV
jgi:predicted nucleic acid-binding protein